MKKLEDKAPSSDHGAQTRYVLKLIESDLSGRETVNAIAPDVLVFLTRELLGKPKAARMAEATSGRDQVALLMQLLESFVHDYENEAKVLKAAEDKPTGSVDS